MRDEVNRNNIVAADLSETGSYIPYIPVNRRFYRYHF